MEKTCNCCGVEISADETDPGDGLCQQCHDDENRKKEEREMRTWEQYTKDEEATHEMTALGSEMLDALCDWLGVDFDPKNLSAAEARIERAVYENTGCGAWIKFYHDRVAIGLGTIIEGSDAEIGPIDLAWPFAKTEFDAVIESIEAEADLLWREANE